MSDPWQTREHQRTTFLAKVCELKNAPKCNTIKQMPELEMVKEARNDFLMSHETCLTIVKYLSDMWFELEDDFNDVDSYYVDVLRCIRMGNLTMIKTPPVPFIFNVLELNSRQTDRNASSNIPVEMETQNTIAGVHVDCECVEVSTSILPDSLCVDASSVIVDDSSIKEMCLYVCDKETTSYCKISDVQIKMCATMSSHVVVMQDSINDNTISSVHRYMLSNMFCVDAGVTPLSNYLLISNVNVEQCQLISNESDRFRIQSDHDSISCYGPPYARHEIIVEQCIGMKGESLHLRDRHVKFKSTYKKKILPGSHDLQHIE